MSNLFRLDAWIKSHDKRADEVTHVVEPWIKNAIEIGYVTVPRKLSVVIGDVRPNYIWIRIVKHVKSLRIGFPIIIYDYHYDEYIAGIIKAMGYDIDDPTLYDRNIIPTQPLTSELVQFNDLSFLELSPLYGIEPYCSLKKGNPTKNIIKESVNFAPHIRAPAFIPPSNIIFQIMGIPDSGIPYGIILVGSDPLVDPNTQTFIPYFMREAILFEHELIVGSTGKGKTVKCKNDIFYFVNRIGGAVIVFDLHGEYEEITEEPLKSYDIHPDTFEFKIWNDLGVKPQKINELVIWQWAKNYEDVDPRAWGFTIEFAQIPPKALQYYLPSLSPQGYVIMPKLIRLFRESYTGEKTFRNFYDWLNIMYLDQSIISNKTREAILRRLSPLIEEEIFDGEGLSDIDVKELLVPKRVSIFRLSTIRNNMIRRIIVLHVLRKIAEAKLHDITNSLPPAFILIDEAHNYFPRTVYDEDERNYIMRAINWVDRICKEGRKFKLRIEFSTQSPEDLHPSVIKTVNTITFFGMNPIQVNIINKFMELPVPASEIMNLPARRAIIYSRNNADIPVKILIPWPLLKHKITKKV